MKKNDKEMLKKAGKTAGHKAIENQTGLNEKQQKQIGKMGMDASKDLLGKGKKKKSA